jgi:hypothetical protein
MGNWWLLDVAQTRRLMLETCPAPSSALMLRRNGLCKGGWNEQMLIADDWCLLLDIVMQQPAAAAFHAGAVLAEATSTERTSSMGATPCSCGARVKLSR